MAPPGFVKNILSRTGMNQPYCSECRGSAREKYTLRIVCLTYGREVLLYSTCDSFERRVGADTPIVNLKGEEEEPGEATRP